MKQQLLLLVIIMLPLVASADESGTCGRNLTWTYSESTKVLTISGSGNMFSYKDDPNSRPWSTFGYLIEKIIIGDGVTSIGDYAFIDCTGLTSVTIPSSLKRVGFVAFSGCTGLTKVNVTDIAAWCGIIFPDLDANPLCYAHHLYSDENTEIKNLVIPNSVTSISSCAFYGCSELTSVTIGNSVASIGDGVFIDCTGLTSISIPNSVTSIGNRALDGCKLEELMIYNVNAKFPKAFSNKTLQHAMLYIPEGTWSDAIYEGDCYLFNNIREVATSTQSLSPSITYNLINTESFGYAVYDETTNKIKMAKAFYSIDENEVNNCWQVQSQSGKNYLYNLGAQKYASVSVDGNITLSAYPVEITITEGENGLILGADTNHRWGFVKSQGQSNPTSINTNIHYDTTDRIHYSLDGRQFKDPQKGINIVRYKDGSTKKVIIK